MSAFIIAVLALAFVAWAVINLYEAYYKHQFILRITKHNEPPERPRRCRACHTPIECSGICEDCQLARDEYQRALDGREIEIMTGRI